MFKLWGDKNEACTISSINHYNHPPNQWRSKSVSDEYRLYDKSVDGGRKNKIIPNIDISPIETEPVRGSIACFDVNDSEMIAIGQSKGEQKAVCIYSQDGSFLYGYAFRYSGAFGIEWDGNNINIYHVRSDLIVTVDRDGNTLEIVRVEDTFENNSYSNYLLHSDERSTDHARYYTRNNMGVLNLFAFSHSQVVMEGPDGEETIIYDVNEMQLARTIIGLIVVVALFAAAIVIPVKQANKLNQGTPQDDQAN